MKAKKSPFLTFGFFAFIATILVESQFRLRYLGAEEDVRVPPHDSSNIADLTTLSADDSRMQISIGDVSLRQRGDVLRGIVGSNLHVHEQRPIVKYNLRPPRRGAVTPNSGRHYPIPKLVPIGEGHDNDGPELYPFWGAEFVDEPTQLLMAIDPDTPGPNADRYERPEEADSLAVEGSIWHELVSKYRYANISALVDVKQPTSAFACLAAAVYTGNCLYLDESFEQCALRVGARRLGRVMFERCRFSHYWLQLEMNIAHRALAGDFEVEERVAIDKAIVSRNKTLSAAISKLPSAAQREDALVRRILAMGDEPVGVARYPWEETFNADSNPNLREERSSLLKVKTQNSSAFSSAAHSPTRRHRYPLRHGPSTQAEICSVNRPQEVPFVPPSKRTVPPMGPPRQCRDGGLQYPIAFGTPSANIVPRLLPKLFEFLPIPLDVPPKPLGYNDEDLYQAMAAMSYFCMTHARGGWDCGRHYEVMGAGCVPYFYDIRASGPYILPHFPKKFFMDVTAMPLFSHIGHISYATGDVFNVSKVNNPFTVDRSFNFRSRVTFVNESFYFKKGEQLNQSWYWSSARRLLKFSKKYLTAEAMASYVIRTMGIEGSEPYYYQSREEEARSAHLVKTLRSQSNSGRSIEEGSNDENKDRKKDKKVRNVIDTKSNSKVTLTPLSAADHELLKKRKFHRRVLIVSHPELAWDNLQQTLATGFDALGYDVFITTNKHQRLYECFEAGVPYKNNSKDERKRWRQWENGDSGKSSAPRQINQLKTQAGLLDRSQSGTRRSAWEEREALDPLMSSEDLATERRLRERAAVHGGGAPWANRMRTRRLTFITVKEHQLMYMEYSLFDAVIFSFFAYDDSSYRYDWRYLSRAIRRTGGKVAVMDGYDTISDPRIDSTLFDKYVYYFSRELRRAFC